MIEHKDITDPNIHEPKGISTSTINRVYIANGSGSGTWSKVKINTLEGLEGDNNIEGRHLVSSGTGTFKLDNGPRYGTMGIVNNITPFNVTAALDPTFNTPSQFVVFTGSGAPWINEFSSGITFNTDRLIAPVKGVYKLEVYFNVGGFPTNTAKLAIRYLLNGTTYSLRKPTIKASGAGDENQITGFGLLNMNTNDYIQLTVASDATGQILIKDANIVLQLVKPIP